VNGRLARDADHSFGDYLNTADRPAEFFPVTGDWEAIPTTNESYGYHKFDHSHKPVSHFIRLLASAASRGGNLLMNIGPKGDGNFDDSDLIILKGIGQWMSKNGESIYGTKAGLLPLQSWGVATTKGNNMYLHVFEWPADGKLYVGGLTKNASNTWCLNNPGSKLKIEYLPSGDAILYVPKQAPDTINTVIVIDKMQSTPPPPEGAGGRSYHFISPNVNLHRLLAYDAQQTGKGFSYGDGKTNKYYVEGWKTKEQHLTWKIRTIQPGNFKMIIKYLAPAATSGGSFNIVVNRTDSSKEVSHFTLPVQTNKDGTVVIGEPGDLLLPVGSYTIQLSPNDIKGAELMKVLEIQLMASRKK
jgi:hypothetical protein